MKNIKTVTVLSCLIAAILNVSIFAQQADLLSAAAAAETKTEMETLLGNVNNQDEYYNLYSGIALHNICREDSELQNTAVNLLKSSYEDTASPIALGYLGSVTTMQAGTASAEGRMIAATSSLSKGISLIDQALVEMPDSVYLRFLRVFNSFDVSESSPVSRIETAENDIKWLSEHMNGAGKENEALLYLAKARLALAKDDYDNAFGFFEKTMAAAPGSKAAEKADKLLWYLEE